MELVAYAISRKSAKSPQYAFTDIWYFSHVIVILGSPYDDTIVGNHLDNDINGRKGSNRLVGGEGRDRYTVNEGQITIVNYALDGKVDILLLNVTIEDVIVRKSSDDLAVGVLDMLVVIHKWFVHQVYRHMLIITVDRMVSNVTSSADPKLVPIIVELSEQKVQQYQKVL